MKNQKGFGVIETILILAIVGIVGGTGFYVYNANKKDVKISDSSIQKSKTKSESKPEEKQETTTVPKYTDFRVNKKDVTGIKIETAADVDKLTGAGNELKAYLKSTVGIEVEVLGGGKEKRSYTIDRIYGNYAAGVSDVPAYLIWGPENGNGAIDSVAGTQDAGMSCSELKKAKVPSELVDGRCLSDGDAREIVPYSN